MVTQLPNRFVLVFLLILSCISLCSSSQWDSPRNVETFYPFAYSPPPHEKSASAPAPDPNYGVSVQSIPPPALPGTSKKAIMTAVGATAASTFVLAVVFFLLLTWYSRSKRRKRIRVGGSNPTPPVPPAVVSAGSGSEYKKVSGNVKGYIVDEDGLDVLYWKKLSNSGGFRKETYSSAEYANRKIPPVPRGKSSSSQSHNQIHPRSSINRSNSGSAGGQPPALSTTAVPKAPAPPLPPPVPQKNAPTVPPPPPPIPGKKNPPPPPSKPPAAPPSKTLEARAKEEASGSGNDDQVKLKPLHWEKVNVNPNHSMVWDKLEKGSFQYNGDMMEALFGVVATKRRSPKQQDSNNNGGEFSNSNPQIFILDPRKSQNVAIVIKSLGIPRDELIDGLLEGKGLTAETLDKLKRIAPTKEEASKILAFDGDSSKLADAESFLYCLLKAIPSAFVRVDEMLFRSSYDSEIFSLKDSLQTLESGCNELRSRGIFLKLLEAILKAGNRLNAGTARGDAKAFNLSTLKKLSDYKSTDGKTTLLHFVVHEVVRNEGRRCVLSQRNSGSMLDDQMAKEEREREFLKLGLPVVGGLSSEFSNVKKAASIDYDALKDTLDSISKSVFKARRITSNETSDDDGDGFLIETRKFFESAEVEVNDLQEEHTRVMGIVKRTTQYYQAGASNGKSPLQLFVTVKDFLGMVDQTCVEIARSLQQKKQTSPTAAGSGSGSESGSTPDVLRSRVTFPRLPEHFLSDKSNSGSDDDS